MTHRAENLWRDAITLEELGRVYLEAIASKVVDEELYAIC